MSELTAESTPDLHLFPRDPEAPLAPAPIRWSLATRLAFRLGFCYLLVYALCCGNATLWEVFPFHIGEHLSDWTSWPFFHAAQWLGQNLFHLTGVGAKLHATGSGDTILDWIALGVMAALALTATLLWSLLSEFRSNPALAYPRLLFWFRLILRLTLGYAMLSYGAVKVFPLQMGPPSLAVLNEPLGNTSPMTMLWTLIGLNPIYEMICGAAEMTAGVLILFRRTALLGTLLTAFLTTNIVLYNFCFDVPVKIYAAHLLLISLALLLPWTPALLNFFILHRPCVPFGGWAKPAHRYGLRIETVATVLVLLLTLIPQTLGFHKAYAAQLASARRPSPWVGQWHVDSATLNNKPSPIPTGDGLPMTDIFIEPSGRTMLRDSSSILWRAGTDFDDKKHTLTLYTQTGDHPFEYTLTRPDPTHVLLTPTGKDAKTTPALTLTHIALPAHYPLQERGFHWVNEWGYER